jgi:signal transduction histidine kinase
VLDLEKYESGQAQLDRTPVALPDVVHEAAEAVAQLARERGIALHLDVPASLPPLLADRDRLMQVLINLLSNAVKACTPGRAGHIRVQAWPTPDALLLSVEDNGKGIALDQQSQIFDKFFQAQNQSLRKPEGSGLGLSITKKIVELHQGRIWVESAPDQGARFFVELPLAPSSQPVAVAEPWQQVPLPAGLITKR